MVHGVAPVLQYLKQVEFETYKQITEDLKSSAEPMRNYVAAGFPNQPWQSAKGVVNWSKYGRTTRGRKGKSKSGASFPKYDVEQVRAGVTIQVGGRKVRRTNSYPILRVRQGDAAGAIYDMAAKNRSGTTAGAKFVGNLQGEASRVMWKRTKASFPFVQKSVMESINAIERKFTGQIAAETERRNAQSIRASAQVRNVLGRFGR